MLVVSQGMATTQGFTPVPETGLDQKLTLHYWGRVALARALAPSLAKVSIVIGYVHGASLLGLEHRGNASCSDQELTQRPEFLLHRDASHSFCWVDEIALLTVFLAVVDKSERGAKVLSVLSAGVHSAHAKWAEDPDTVWSLIWGLSCLAVGIFATPRNRGRLIQFLSSRGAAGSKEGEAAAVSALVGGGSAADALAKGASRFRALPLSRLSAEDLTTNQDTGLYKKTAEASLGAVSGFVSHSWADDGAAKFVQLQAWGHEARRGEGLKDPLIWLDKVRAPTPAARTAATPSLTTPSRP